MKKRKGFSKKLLDPKVRGWRALMGAFKSTLVELEKGLNRYECSPSRFQVLFFIYMDGPMLPVELSRKLLVTRGNITGLIRRMEEDGLIECLPHESSKRLKVHLTGSGVAFFEEIFPEHIKNVNKVLPDFPIEVISFLEELANNDKQL